MTNLTRGGNAPLPGGDLRIVVEWVPGSASGEVDAAAFLLGASGKVSGDADMVFYGQPEGTAVRFARRGDLVPGRDASAFEIATGALPAAIERVAFSATLDDAAAKGIHFGMAEGLRISAWADGREVVSFSPPKAEAGETALVLAELYRRDGAWKFRAVGAGYSDGLAPLARNYGVDVSAPAGGPPPSAPKIDLRKRTVDLAKRDPELGANASAALDALQAKGIAGVRARFGLVLDISASMMGLFRSGKVDALVRRALGAAIPLDDDGEIDVFVFGRKAHVHGPLTESTYKGFAARCEALHGFEDATYYGEALALVREHYRRTDNGLPVYVMFVTDGGTGDVRRSETQVKEASREPIFWQFMAIGEYDRKPGLSFPKIGRSLPRGFEFLAHLDKMEGRLVDNANFFAVEDPAAPSDAELFGMMFAEFPDWLAKARELRIVKDPA
jgi:stress response protein SCP2